MQSANFTKQCPKHEDARRTLESDGIYPQNSIDIKQVFVASATSEERNLHMSIRVDHHCAKVAATLGIQTTLECG